jgi:hypothetical protein
MQTPARVELSLVTIGPKESNIFGMLRRAIAVVGTGVALSVATPVLAIPTASVDDTHEGGIFTGVADIDILANAIGTESWTMTGNIHIPFGAGVLIGVHNFVLDEPGGGGISDIFTVTAQGCPDGGNPNIGACQAGPVDFLQQVLFSFTSDAEGPLAAPTLGSIDCRFVETGANQSCNIAGFVLLQVASDVVEPATLALLGLGLAGFGVRRKSAA